MLRPDKELLTAWLLLLLDQRPTYGYQLGRELDTHGVSVDLGRMYRRLRALDQLGWVQSRWMRSIGGPRRRLYRLSPEGRRMLEEIDGLIQALYASHDAFVRAYDGLGSSAPAPGDGALRTGKPLLTAWLLLLLDDGESHGYQLGGWLAEEGVTVAPSALYRNLRTLEDEGCIASHWGDPKAGPRRRIYELTPAGRRALDELATTTRAHRGRIHAFLQAHERARRRRPQISDGRGAPSTSA